MFREVGGVRYATPGDRARVLADGRIQLLGRGSLCINTGGEKVYPEEVEQVLRTHPAVLDAAVVGVPDARWGEMVTAVVELRPARELDDTVGAHARASLAGYKVPKRCFPVDTLFRTVAGKPDYRPGPRALVEELVAFVTPETGVQSIAALAQWAAGTHGDAEAVVDGDTRLSFRQLAELADRATR